MNNAKELSGFVAGWMQGSLLKLASDVMSEGSTAKVVTYDADEGRYVILVTGGETGKQVTVTIEAKEE